MTTTPVVISVSREEVELCDPTGVVSILVEWVPTLVDRNQHRLQIEIRGYLDDPRELFDISEVQLYFQTLVSAYPGLAFWIDWTSHMPILLALCLFQPIRIDTQVTVSSQDMQQFVYLMFTGLNRFCESTGLSPEPTNAAVRAWIGMPGPGGVT